MLTTPRTGFRKLTQLKPEPGIPPGSYRITGFVLSTYPATRAEGKEALMRLPRSRVITKIIVLALIIYAGASLLTIRGNIEDARDGLGEARRAVAELEISNAELEYEIENYNEPDVIANIARSSLGLVLPGEIVFFDPGIRQDSEN